MSASMETSYIHETSKTVKDFLENISLRSIHDLDIRPCMFLELVYMEIELFDINGRRYRGWVHTVDPVSKSIVLVEFGEGTCVHVIMGHALKSLNVLNENKSTRKDELDSLFELSKGGRYTKQDLVKRKNAVRDWLERNRIPVMLTGEKGENLTVSNALYIVAPYRPEDCISTNEIILDRVQSLLRSRPDDEETVALQT
ncbi:gem-associated protein 6-like isoform X1 [Anneissia japonica]|uniref:gem-associated protein 6-like isoform X1 n=1 Tax=Anneissia japonica TaxID=1529436 RepID=UPI0014259577|nr:gem-associated protein 6-like isoform X1 [Anneissia japonica]